MSQSLEGLVVAITGAGKGLGRAYALHLAGLGARVVVNNRSHPGEERASADRVVQQIRDAGGEAVAEYGAVEQRGSGERLLQTALDHWGRLDAVIANAGVSEHGSFHKQELDALHRVIEVNLTGTVNTLHSPFRYLYEQGGGSVLVSTSAAGLYGQHGLPAYSAAKAGVLGLMRSLSQEGSRRGVRVNAVAPYAATAMTEDALTPALRQSLAPERVAPVVAWLVSRDCPLTGEIVVAGGGRMSRASLRETATLDSASPDAERSDPNDETWSRLRAQPLDRAYESALQHFAAFAGAPGADDR